MQIARRVSRSFDIMARDGRLQKLLNSEAPAPGAAAPAPANAARPQGSLRVMSAASMAQLMGAIAPVIDTFSGPSSRARTATGGSAPAAASSSDINPAIRAVTQLLATVGALSPTDQQTVMNMIPDTIALATRGYQAAAAPVGTQLFDTMSQFAQQMTTFSAGAPSSAPAVAPWLDMLGGLARSIAGNAPAPASAAGHATRAAPGPSSLEDVAKQLSALTDQMVAESQKHAPAPAPKKD